LYLRQVAALPEMDRAQLKKGCGNSNGNRIMLLKFNSGIKDEKSVRYRLPVN
jgi:hypothetical protein